MKKQRSKIKQRSWKKKPILLNISKEFVFVVKFQGNVSNWVTLRKYSSLEPMIPLRD